MTGFESIRSFLIPEKNDVVLMEHLAWLGMLIPADCQQKLFPDLLMGHSNQVEFLFQDRPEEDPPITIPSDPEGVAYD